MKMKKTLTLILALVLIAALAVGGTLAYFTAQTEEAENKFQVSGSGVEVDPTPDDPEDKPDDDAEVELEPNWDDDDEHPIIPGETYVKDPMIRLSSESLAAYVYIRVKEENNFFEDLVWTDATGASQTSDVTVIDWKSQIQTGWVAFTPGEGNEHLTGDNAVAYQGYYYYYWNGDNDTTTAILEAGEGAQFFRGSAEVTTVVKNADGTETTVNGTYGYVQINPALTTGQIQAIYTKLHDEASDATEEVKLFIKGYAIQEATFDSAVDAFNAAANLGYANGGVDAVDPAV